MFALVLFGCTLKVEVSHSDRDVDTVGRVHNCGFPMPWIHCADGMSIVQALGGARWWLLPVNMGFWVVVGCLFFRVRGLKGFAGSMALAQVPLLAVLCLFLVGCAGLEEHGNGEDGGVRAVIEEYGIYTNLVIAGRSEGEAREWLLTGQELVRTTTRIPCAAGVAFGFRFRLEGEPDPDVIHFCTLVPPEDGGDRWDVFHFARTAAETRANPFIGYCFDPGEPMPCGSYTMAICTDTHWLCQMSFEVVPEGEAAGP